MLRKIKKYTNRKLYDLTQPSGYVTYTHIINMVKEGDNIEVFDSATKKDITHHTLVYAIQKLEEIEPTSAPVGVLEEIIKCGGLSLYLVKKGIIKEEELVYVGAYSNHNKRVQLKREEEKKKKEELKKAEVANQGLPFGALPLAGKKDDKTETPNV